LSVGTQAWHVKGGADSILRTRECRRRVGYGPPESPTTTRPTVSRFWSASRPTGSEARELESDEGSHGGLVHQVDQAGVDSLPVGVGREVVPVARLLGVAGVVDVGEADPAEERFPKTIGRGTIPRPRLRFPT